MKFTRLVIGAFALLLLLPAARGGGEYRELIPTTWDYGGVVIGDRQPMAFTFESIGPNPLLVDDILDTG